jgi:hypothetical protein
MGRKLRMDRSPAEKPEGGIKNVKVSEMYQRDGIAPAGGMKPSILSLKTI